MKRAYKRKYPWKNKHIRYISAIMLACAVIYYLPVIGGLLGWDALENSLDSLHNLYGIDLLGLVFFAPVVYTAYTFGVIPAIISAFVAMVLLLPHAILIDNYPNALFKPTAFVIILSAVGAVVAMLQRSEQEQRQRMKEMKCLYDIGRATSESNSVDEFLMKVVSIIPQSMQYPDETKVRVSFNDKVFKSPGFQKSYNKVSENLIVGGDTAGTIEIYATHNNPYLKKRNHLTKTLAERIGSAIRQMELEYSLRTYYEQLEDDVDLRTKDLEKVQEKLIRSERLAAVGELASGVGHELRNPLNVIRNCAYLLNMALSDKKGDEEARETLQVLDKQIDIANKIVTDLLDFTRIKPPAQSKVDLRNIIHESLSWVSVPENIKIHNSTNGNPLFVKTDAEQINRVFTNIISNAIQSMSRDGELKIDAMTDDDYAWIQFKDNGCGIPEDNIEKIFEPLFTTKPKGIGLGLAITKRLVEQNEGQIEVSSQPGKGTTFTVKIPLEKRRQKVNEG
jgi:signal transduction histidine kinase